MPKNAVFTPMAPAATDLGPFSTAMPCCNPPQPCYNPAMRAINFLAIFSCLLMLFALGCSQGDRPELAPVTGTVTLDGKPLERAAMMFRPEEGRASRGITDASGHYELIYLRDIRGARIGSHTVSIMTRTESRPVERVPAKYNKQSTLTREVKDEQNVFDFELKSQ